MRHVCPTGVDIRDGAQLGCIQCGLCIDACDNVMAKIGRPTAADRLRHRRQHQAARSRASSPFYKIVRMRTVLYAAHHRASSAAIMLYTLATRAAEGISVIHDRNPMFVRLSDGALRNGYTIRIVNKTLESRRSRSSVDGLPSTLASRSSACRYAPTAAP